MAVSCQGSTHSRETLRGCPRHPFSTADFCVSLSDMPEGNWGTVKTLVILSWIKLISWLCFYICEPTKAHCENGSWSMKEKKLWKKKSVLMAVNPAHTKAYMWSLNTRVCFSTCTFQWKWGTGIFGWSSHLAQSSAANRCVWTPDFLKHNDQVWENRFQTVFFLCTPTKYIV